MFVEFILKNLNTIYDKLLNNPVSDEEVKILINKLKLFNLDDLPINFQKSLLKDRQ